MKYKCKCDQIIKLPQLQLFIMKMYAVTVKKIRRNSPWRSDNNVSSDSPLMVGRISAWTGWTGTSWRTPWQNRSVSSSLSPMSFWPSLILWIFKGQIFSILSFFFFLSIFFSFLFCRRSRILQPTSFLRRIQKLLKMVKQRLRNLHH